jgi:uncharacterized protein (DUF433 family)
MGKNNDNGRYIVADPKICLGKPTFRGTRIMVWQVLDQVASGMPWKTIVQEWDGKVSKEAISEAVRMARDALVRRKNASNGAMGR